MLNRNLPTDPHSGMPVLYSGADAAKASAAMIMVHGRGANPESILSLSEELEHHNKILFAAPSAAGNTWYPYSFMTPEKENEPYLSSALSSLTQLISETESKGIPPSKIFLLGFSQGACLTLEYAARNAKKYAGIFALSGGLIGDTLDRSKYKGTFDGTPILLGCSDIDPHIPLRRVNESSEVLTAMGADVTKKIYANMGHTINIDEINIINSLIISFLN